MITRTEWRAQSTTIRATLNRILLVRSITGTNTSSRLKFWNRFRKNIKQFMKDIQLIINFKR